MLVNSLAPISIKCALVLKISAGKATKLPKGKLLTLIKMDQDVRKGEHGPDLALTVSEF